MKYITFVSAAALIAVSAAGVAHAQSTAQSVSANTSINVGTEVNLKRNMNAQASSSASVGVKGNATSSAAKSDRSNTPGNATSTAAKDKKVTTTVNTKGSVNSETHRSAVAIFVKSLLSVADREGGIGPQVRVVAKSQNDSASTTVSAIAKVEERGFIRIFFFGPDYKNLALIRSEIATTTANIAKLKVLLEQTTNTAIKAELTLEIQALEAEVAKLEAYVTARENAFSIFGRSKTSVK